MKDGELVAMAGLWEQWEDLQTFTIIVTEGNSRMKPIHYRMPVILYDDTWKHSLTAKDINVPTAKQPEDSARDRTNHCGDGVFKWCERFLQDTYPVSFRADAVFGRVFAWVCECYRCSW